MADGFATIKRQKSFETIRQTAVETTWRECFDLTFPLRGNGIQGRQDTPDSGQNQQSRLYDSTAPDACNVLAANIMSGMTPANARWFGFDAGEETEEEKRWLYEAADLLWQNIHNSNFDSEAFEGCLDAASAGMFALYVDEDPERGGLVFQQWPLSSVYVGSTRADGKINIVHRKYDLSAEAAVREFGADNVSEAIRKANEKGGDEMFTFIHAIYPRDTYVVGARLAKNLPIASCTVEQATGKEVRESGYHEMPVTVPRWLRVPGSVYAVGPMYAALPDVRTLNDLKKLEYDSADIAVSGMWKGVDDGVFNAKKVKIGARKVISVAEIDNFVNVASGANFEISEMLAMRLTGNIRKIMMADNFPPPDQSPATAYEWSVRVDMLRKLLGPMYGRFQSEYLQPLVERCFGLAYRAGVFKPAPESLANKVFSVRYESPLARSQKLDDVLAIESTIMAYGQAAALDPTIMDELDMSESMKLMAEGRGAPSAIRRKPEDVAKLRKARAEAEAEQKNQAIMAQGAEAAAIEGGKVMGQQMAGAGQ